MTSTVLSVSITTWQVVEAPRVLLLEQPDFTRQLPSLGVAVSVTVDPELIGTEQTVKLPVDPE